MNTLLTFLIPMVSCLLLCACPYVDHGTSKAAEIVTLEELQGCYYYGRISNNRAICTQICIDSVAHIIEKEANITFFEDSSFVIDKIVYSRSYDNKISLGKVEKDGARLYTFYMKHGDYYSGTYRLTSTGSLKKRDVEYTTKESFACDF